MCFRLSELREFEEGKSPQAGDWFRVGAGQSGVGVSSEEAPTPRGSRQDQLASWVGRAGLTQEAGFPTALVCVQRPATGSAQTDRHTGRWTRKRC